MKKSLELEAGDYISFEENGNYARIISREDYEECNLPGPASITQCENGRTIYYYKSPSGKGYLKNFFGKRYMLHEFQLIYRKQCMTTKVVNVQKITSSDVISSLKNKIDELNFELDFFNSLVD